MNAYTPLHAFRRLFRAGHNLYGLCQPNWLNKSSFYSCIYSYSMDGHLFPAGYCFLCCISVAVRIPKNLQHRFVYSCFAGHFLLGFFDFQIKGSRVQMILTGPPIRNQTKFGVYGQPQMVSKITLLILKGLLKPNSKTSANRQGKLKDKMALVIITLFKISKTPVS